MGFFFSTTSYISPSSCRVPCGKVEPQRGPSSLPNVSVHVALTDGVSSKVEIVYTYDFGGKHYPGSYDVLFLWGTRRGDSRNNF